MQIIVYANDASVIIIINCVRPYLHGARVIYGVEYKNNSNIMYCT